MVSYQTNPNQRRGTYLPPSFFRVHISKRKHHPKLADAAKSPTEQVRFENKKTSRTSTTVQIIAKRGPKETDSETDWMSIFLDGNFGFLFFH